MSLFSPRAKQFVQSRQLSPLVQSLDQHKRNLWIHCASHGEYETAKPLILRYQSHFNIHLTFYSPSGYQVAVNEQMFWNSLRYLCLDQSSKLEAQITKIDPDFVVFIQYEYWYHLLKNLNQRSIPFLYYGVQLNTQHLLTKAYARFLKTQVNESQLILTRDVESQQVAVDLFDTVVNEVGDVRWLQANSTHKENYEFPFDTNKYEQIIVLGSAWKEDVKLWQSYIKQSSETLFIVAPHDIRDENIQVIYQLLDCQSDIWLDQNGNRKQSLTSNILIVNVLGHLKYLYRIADLVYIGGGLGRGLHNCLEAAIYNVPILISGDGNSNPEARGLINHQLAYPISQKDEIEVIITKLVSSHDITKSTSYLAAELKKSQQAYILIDKILNV